MSFNVNLENRLSKLASSGRKKRPQTSSIHNFHIKTLKNTETQAKIYKSPLRMRTNSCFQDKNFSTSNISKLSHSNPKINPNANNRNNK